VNRTSSLLVCLLIVALLPACTTQPIQRKDGSNSQQSFNIMGLAKGDIDDVAEFSQRQIIGSLKTLTLKFYRRNPNEWRKSGYGSPEEAATALFEPMIHWNVSPLGKLNWKDALNNAWREDYTGDRVKSLMNGLLVMHMAAFDNQTEFYLLTRLDAQKLYNAARNTEAVAWKVSNAKNLNGEPLLISNSFDANGAANLSFEREFGKLIGIEDTLALIIEDKTNREIRFGVVNAAKMIFLPI